MRRVTVFVAAGLLVAGIAAAATPARAATNLLTNPGFDTNLAGWSCSSLDQRVTSPTHSGAGALAGTPAGSDFAQCAQTVSVQPSSAYTLTGWVQGAYAFLGDTGTGTTDTSTWTAGSSSWTQLSTSFTTGASTHSVTVWVHGWYGTGTFDADDLVLSGPAGGGGGTTPPAAPTGLTVTGTTASSVSLSWTAPAGTVTGYHLFQNNTQVQDVPAASTTVTGLAAATTYTFAVTAYNSAGESPKSAPVSATTSTGGGGGGGGLPTHALVGYLHASFANGSGYLRMADVPSDWDVIDLAFGEPTAPTSGQIQFVRCTASECPNVESDADFLAAIRAKQAAGAKVLISIGGANGQVQLTTTAARDAFVSSVEAIIDRWGLNGLDIDFEGHSLSLNAGDTDFRSPTTPVVVNLISALRTLKAHYGSGFVLTMAPETFFVQLGYQFYGPGPNGSADPRSGAYLPVIYALRNDLTLLHVQDYNSGPVMGLDNQYHTMGGADFHIAMTDMLLTGFPVAGNTANMFPALAPSQVAIGLPASSNAGNGYTAPATVDQALDCLTKKTSCGGYTTHGQWPALRGLMTWSVNWDHFGGWEFSNNFHHYFG